MLGRYLGPAIDVGPVMMDNIMKSNGKVVHSLKYHSLKEDEKFNQSHISLGKESKNSIRDIFGPDISPYDFPYFNLEDMPIYDMY